MKIPELDNDWRWIKGYHGLYSVSERGEVWSQRRKRYLICSVNIPHGYRRVTLSNKNVSEQPYVHRLVAQAFIGDKPNGFVCNHKDGNKMNNHISNLEYVTPIQNIRHAHKMGLGAHGSRHGLSVLNETKVKEIRAMHKNRRSGYEATAKIYGVIETTIGNVVRRRSWRHV